MSLGGDRHRRDAWPLLSVVCLRRGRAVRCGRLRMATVVVETACARYRLFLWKQGIGQVEKFDSDGFLPALRFVGRSRMRAELLFAYFP